MLFERLGYPQWFRTVTGLTETAGALGLLAGVFAPALSALAGLLLSATMTGALFSHARAKDSARTMASPAVLLVLALTVAALEYRSLGI